MGEKFGKGRTLAEKFESLAGEVDGAIAIATPDDLGGIQTTHEMNPSRAVKGKSRFSCGDGIESV